jgi:hypothetical protein
MEQLEIFSDKEIIDKGKRTNSYEINWNNIIGVDSNMKDVKGYEDLSDKAQDALKYLILNHAHPEDGFIHAARFAHILGLGLDTRTLRKLMAEIDYKTEYVVYPSQHGYKLAASKREIEEAVKFALAPAMTAIRRTYAKNKIETQEWLHGFLGNLAKEFGGVVQGQQEMTDDMELRTVNHYPKVADTDYMPSVEERENFYENKLKELRR